MKFLGWILVSVIAGAVVALIWLWRGGRRRTRSTRPQPGEATMAETNYRASIDVDLAQRLDELAAVMYAARDFKYSLSDLGPPGPSSAAAHDSRAASEAFESPTLGQRAYFFADIWLTEIAHHLGGLGALYEQREVVFAPLPLVRTVLELSARIGYVLEPATNTRERAARAIIEDGYATEAMAKAEKRIHGRTALYQDLRNRVAALRREVEEVFGSAPSGAPHEWEIEGQQFIGPSESVHRFGDIQGAGRLHEGIYDRLSTHAHPSLGALLFFDRDSDGRPTGIRIPRAELEALAQDCLAFFYLAAKHFVRYAGWIPDPLGPFEVTLEFAFPTFFIDADHGSRSTDDESNSGHGDDGGSRT